jgi:hypothetical protein
MASVSSCLVGLIWYAVEISTLLMIHLVVRPSPSLCFRRLPVPKKVCVKGDEPLFLAKSGCAVVLELLVESVTVADSGDVIAFKGSVWSRILANTWQGVRSTGLLFTHRTTSRSQQSDQDLQFTVSIARGCNPQPL